MNRLLLVLLGLFLVLPLLAAPPADEGFESENKSKGVKPPKVPPPALSASRDDDKKDEDKKPERDNKKEDKKDSKKGDKTLDASDIDALKEQEDKDVTVSGKVYEVYVNPNKTVAILNFGSNHRKCFKAVIFERNFEKFDGGLNGIKGYKGKTVKVSGKIGLRDEMPQIIVTVPSQIKKG